MRPDDGAWSSMGTASVIEQTFQRRHHVPVADVPGFRAASEHRAVVGFGVTDDPRVLFGDEVLVGGDASVALGVSAALRRRSTSCSTTSSSHECSMFRLAV